MNGTDPSGEITCPSYIPGCGVITDAQNALSGSVDDIAAAAGAIVAVVAVVALVVTLPFSLLVAAAVIGVLVAAYAIYRLFEPAPS